MTPTRFDRFDRSDFTFKVVHAQPLQATILTSKALQEKDPAEYPVLVYWHGGGFVVGHRMYEAWFPRGTLLDLSLTTPTLPESSAAEILSDVEAFWTWLHGTLPTTLAGADRRARPDLSRIACAGTSAGGYLAVQSSLLLPQFSNIKVLISIAGALHTAIPHFSVPTPKVILGRRAPPPREAERILRAYVRDHVKSGAVRVGGDPVEMRELLTCVVQQGCLLRWLGMRGAEGRFDVMMRLEGAGRMPPIWVVHGEGDSVVPPLCSTGFVEKVRQVLPHVPVLLSLRPGDHGFEVNDSTEDEWIQEGFRFLAEHWP